MNNTLEGITDDIRIIDNKFDSLRELHSVNELRNIAFVEYKRGEYDESKLDELMNYIRETFIIERDIDKSMNELIDNIWKIKNKLDSIKKIY